MCIRDSSYSGGDAFLVKLNSGGNALQYSTFLGGSGGEQATSLVVDGSGKALVGGWTFSSDFPTSAGAFDRSINGSADAFVATLNAAGNGLDYGTYLGGPNADHLHSLAFDAAGGAYVSGKTNSVDYPTTAGAFDRSYNGGTYDAFVTKLALNGAIGPTATPTRSATPTATRTPTRTATPVSYTHLKDC